LKDLLSTIVTELNCFGTFLERHDKAALTVHSLTSVAAKRLCREQCLKQALVIVLAVLAKIPFMVTGALRAT
jgi:hypothetical protein